MKCINKLLLIIVIGFMFTFLSSSKTYSQLASIKHDLAKYHQTWLASWDWSSGQQFYPAGSYKNTSSTCEYPFVIAEKYTLAGGAVETENPYWYRYSGGQLKSEVLMMHKKHQPPSIIVNGLELAPPFAGNVDPSLDSDTKMENRVKYWTTLPGVITLLSRSYVNENHDDYLLWQSNIEFNLDLDGDGADDLPEQTVNIIYSHTSTTASNQRAFAAYGRESIRRHITWHHAEHFPVESFVTGAPRDELAVSLSYHADRTAVHRPYGWEAAGSGGELDESGAPMGPETGPLTIDNCELIAPQYAGLALLHTDKSVTDTDDWTEVPEHTGKLKIGPDLWSGGFVDRYNWLLSGWNDIREDELGYEDPYRYYSSNVYQFQTWGPYAMQKGQSFNSVYVHSFGSVGNDLAREKGLEFMKWYRDGEGTFDHAAKNAFIAQGQDSLLLNINRAYWNYYAKDFDIPDPLGAPDIEVTPGPDLITVEWGYPTADGFKDPDTGADDFKEWRVYRKLGHLEVNHPSDNAYLTYDLIGTFDKGTTQFNDTGVIRGESYHYLVTAVDDGSQNTGGLFPGQELESSFYANRTPAGAAAFKPGLSTSEDVLIVPNPYSISTGTSNQMNYTGKTNNILFVNLPAYCTLKIYTVTGDLIKTLEHTSGSGDQAWGSMRTDANQAPVSGVYIVVVDNAKDVDKNPLPKKMYKFVIVR